MVHNYRDSIDQISAFSLTFLSLLVMEHDIPLYVAFLPGNVLNYSVPHEESRKMFLFIVHFASFLQNQLSYGHVVCTTMIPYLP